MAFRDRDDNRQHDNNDNHNKNTDDTADNDIVSEENDHQEDVTLAEIDDLNNWKGHKKCLCGAKNSPNKTKYADDMFNDANEVGTGLHLTHAESDIISDITPEISKYGNHYHHSKRIPLQKWPRPTSNYGNLFSSNTNVNVNLEKEKSTITHDGGIIPSEKCRSIGTKPRFDKERIYSDVLKEISPYLIKHGLHGVFSQQLETSLVVMPVGVRKGRNDVISEEENVVDGSMEGSHGHHQTSTSQQLPPEPSQPVQDQSEHQTIYPNQYQSGTGNQSRHREYPGQPEPSQDQTTSGRGTTSLSAERIVPPRPKVYYLLTKGMLDSSTPHLSAASSLIGNGTHLNYTRRWRRSSQIPSLPDQYQLVVRMTEKTIYIAAIPRSIGNTTSSAYKRDLTNYVQQWQHYLTREGFPAEMQTTNIAPIVVAYGSTSAILQELASEGFGIAGVMTDIDPVTLLTMHQREDFNLSIQPLQESNQTLTPTLFSQLEPESYDHSKTGTTVEFITQSRSSYDYSSLVQGTWDESSSNYRVNCEASQATSDRLQSPTSPLSKYSQGFVSPPAVNVEDSEAFEYHHPKSQHGHHENPSSHQQSLSQLLEQLPIEEIARVHQRTVFVREETTNAGILLPPPIIPPDPSREHDIVNIFPIIDNTHYTGIVTPSYDQVHDDYQVTCQPVQETNTTVDDNTDTDDNAGFISTSASKMDISEVFI